MKIPFCDPPWAIVSKYLKGKAAGTRERNFPPTEGKCTVMRKSCANHSYLV